MKKIKLILIFVLSIALINTVKTTYARYASETDSDVSINIARWEISVNNTDITNNNSSSIDITPTFDTNSNVMANKLAPGSTGYFDVLINPTNTDVSFTYTITATPNNTIADLKIKTYEIIDNDNQVTTTSTYSNNITNNVLYSEGGHDSFTIRVHFEWVDDETGTMDDDDDTAIASQISDDDFEVNINVSISFNQYIENSN